MTARLLAALVGLVAATSLVAGDDPNEDPSEDLASLVAAERAFACTSADEGMRAAFLTWLGEGSVVFRPQPVDARAWYGRIPDAPGTLAWEPTFAEISPAGDMGWTTGPYEYRPADSAQPSSYGHYVSVWGRRPDGSWRVRVDHGAPHPEAMEAGPLEFPRHNRATAPRGRARVDTMVTVDALFAADMDFTRAVERRGLRRTYRSFVAEDVRLYRNGELPVLGRAAVSAVFDRQAAPRRWTPERAGASVSGTLGYTIGRVDQPDRDPSAGSGGSYLRIWRKEGNRWKLVVDMLPDAPPEPED